MSILSWLFNSIEDKNNMDYKEEQKKIFRNYTRNDLMNLLKQYGYYNDYKDYSNQYIIDKFVDKARYNKKLYKVW